MSKDSIGLTDFKIPLNKIAPLQIFRNRENIDLSYRFYSSWSERLLIFYHGIGGDSRYICALASHLADNNIANVLTPDLRGHGKSRQEVAQVSGPQALLNDLQDLLQVLGRKYSDKELWLGGHSLGGGLALKALCHPELASYFREAIVVSPYLHYAAFAEGGLRFSSWLQYSSETGRIHLQMPAGYKSGSEVLNYDLAFFEAASLNSSAELGHLTRAFRPEVVASTGDLLSPAERYQQLLTGVNVRLAVLQDYSHMGLVMAPGALASIAELLG